jgi:hypothetical protein
MKKMKGIPKLLKENLEYIPDEMIPKILSEDLTELYGFEASGLADWTISEIISLFQDLVKQYRQKAKPSEVA